MSCWVSLKNPSECLYEAQSSLAELGAFSLPYEGSAKTCASQTHLLKLPEAAVALHLQPFAKGNCKTKRHQTLFFRECSWHLRLFQEVRWYNQTFSFQTSLETMTQPLSRPSSTSRRRKRRRTPTFSIPWTGRRRSWITRRQTEPDLRRGGHRQAWSLLPKLVPSGADCSRLIKHWQTTWWFFVWMDEEFNATKAYWKSVDTIRGRWRFLLWKIPQSGKLVFVQISKELSSLVQTFQTHLAKSSNTRAQLQLLNIINIEKNTSNGKNV